MDTFEVVSPLGIDALARQRAAPRLASLDGKKIGEVWNGVFKGDATFPLLRAALTARFPDLRFVPFTQFPHVPGADNPAAQRERARAIAALAKDAGCDAVIAGNGA
jgi:hypothetical protein